ncbi:MAG TPA: PaaI family thioesterase [Polyangia bacterium]|nr:PaaI family thioesterase [Polyangia bacterium]
MSEAPRFAPGLPVGPLGFVPREAGNGTAVWEYTVDPAHYNTNGVLHGGVLMALLDTAMGHAVAAMVAPQGRFNAAAQFNIHFFVPIKSGLVRARAEVKKLGKRLAVAEAEATDEDGRLLGVATSTHSLLP